MKENQFVLRNLGMNRDLSVSKVGESTAFENRNIRIIARDNDTLLSVTNERGTKEIDLGDNVSIQGTIIGWNVLNNHVILFTHKDPSTDRIYRLDYNDNPGAGESEFTIVHGNVDGVQALFEGNLGFDNEHPIESIVYAETEDIQKIYWVDGKNVLRFMDFVKRETVHVPRTGDIPARTYQLFSWEKINRDITSTPPSVTVEVDNTYFDSNRAAKFGVSVSITKDNAGNTRANGTVQYLLTYFNKHGQETGYVWISDLVYLSPLGRGGAADETNNNRVTLGISGLDTTFSHFRVYSVFRSSLNGQITAFLVDERNTTSGTVNVVDDGAHLTNEDATRLLYLGSIPVIAGTMTHKDNTLFLGNLLSTGRANFDDIEAIIRKYMFTYNDGELEFTAGTTWESGCVSFVYTNDSSSGTNNNSDTADIPYIDNVGDYPYKNQLLQSSSEILTFKGGEKYRFALKFKYRDGAETDAFWIGDKENILYPVIDVQNQEGPHIKRVVAKCTIPAKVIEELKELEDGFEFGSVQLCIAEATYADRSVKAQGIVNPTMFNTWERFNNRLYSVPSWISRPRGSSFANRHFASVANSNSSAGEIQCNYWEETTGAQVPFYRYQSYPTSPTYMEEFQGKPDYSHVLLVYKIGWHGSRPVDIGFDADIRIITGKVLLDSEDDPTALTDMLTFFFGNEDFKDWDYVDSNPDDSKPGYYTYSAPSDRLFNDDATPKTRFILKAWHASVVGGTDTDWTLAADNLRSRIATELTQKQGIVSTVFENEISVSRFRGWCELVKNKADRLFDTSSNNLFVNYYFTKIDQGGWTSAYLAMNNYASETAHPTSARWSQVDTSSSITNVGTYTPAYGKKNLMFVDENIVTLDSPELALEAINFDDADLQFRLVGVAKMSSVMSDYNIDASVSSSLGTSYDKETFSGSINDNNPMIQGLLSWPLWKEYGLDVKEETKLKGKATKDMDISDYIGGTNVVRYWMYMWQHSGVISGFSTNFTVEDDTENDVGALRKPSVLHDKMFANLHFSYNTIYNKNSRVLASESLRVVYENSHSYYTVKVGGVNKYYEGYVQLPLTMPWSNKYPIFYSSTRPDSSFVAQSSDTYYLQSNAPVMLEYGAGSHAVISLQSQLSGGVYQQVILPSVFSSENISFPSASGTLSAAFVPWLEEQYYNSYSVASGNLFPFGSLNVEANAETLSAGDQYLFIGEIFKDYGSSDTDTRYGGISDAAIRNNRFIAAGPVYDFAAISEQEGGVYVARNIFGNQGDTYFQRWDAVRTKPYSEDAVNKVIDITSFMVETHINLDGRTDLQRGIPELASVDLTKYGSINPAYSQQNNFSVRRDLDADFNTDVYRSSITWTLPKTDMADVDEWTHITLANTMKLDSDKGICQALRRFQNSIIAFQDRAVSEVLFNSRTQLTTNDGVPVEIANSGKVDGKRYITNKYGCVNKWSIVEGKASLYWVDNINKAFCGFNGQIENLSEKLGFGVWFRNGNTTVSWEPVNFTNIVSFYDRIHSDVYLVRSASHTDAPCLVYNELLQRFTSFYDYGSIPMMTNVGDRFISAHGHALWFQNEGLYCDFFGTLKPFWTQYRVTPNPYGDKIWTNVEYRADFYKVIDDGADIYSNEQDFVTEDAYIPDETFDSMRFWNEYQTTPEVVTTTADEGQIEKHPVKKFRIWRLAIPRAVQDEKNKYGLDRIRNPWLNLQFKKNTTDGENLMQLHDIIVKYFE